MAYDNARKNLVNSNLSKKGFLRYTSVGFPEEKYMKKRLYQHRLASWRGMLNSGVISACASGLVLCCVGCAPQSPKVAPSDVTEDAAPQSSTSDDIVGNGVRDLVVSASDPRALLSINSLLVEEPILATGVTLQGVQSEELQGIVEEIAAQELSLKVYGTEWMKKNLKPGLKRVPSSAGIDAILVTELLQYRDREGSRIGGEPGAVAFRMTVVRLSDRGEIWGATYSLKEESVTDNLFRIGERFGASSTGLGWQSGRELFKRGVTSALESFSTTREEQFLRRGDSAKQ
jgi:hypothetical protein